MKMLLMTVFLHSWKTCSSLDLPALPRLLTNTAQLVAIRQSVIIRRTDKVVAVVLIVDVGVPDFETSPLHELVLLHAVDPASHNQL